MAASRPRQIESCALEHPPWCWCGNGSESNLIENVQMAYTPLICNSVSAIFVPTSDFHLAGCMLDR
uniref:Uncharacterized protein n=1 Tax=Zea mays TaxID=4577 RepID=B6UCT6_MAIZE|nr:hypothetical protein [Zea mays]